MHYRFRGVTCFYASLLFSFELLLFGLCFNGLYDDNVYVAALPAQQTFRDVYSPLTRERYTLHVGRVQPSLDEEGKDPVLVSVANEVSFFFSLEDAAAFKDAGGGTSINRTLLELLSFSEEYDPIWYYLLRQHGLSALEWSGCGGNWRPEWSLPPPSWKYENSDDAATHTARNVSPAETFVWLRHFLSNHVVCSFSSASICGQSTVQDPADQFQWVANFMAGLTSSPLGWTQATPQHSRPSGIMLQWPLVSARTSNFSNFNASSNEKNSWCSYHLINHDTLCAHHMTPLLHGGRHGSGVQEDFPVGIFQATMTSLGDFVSMPFYHFRFHATQRIHHGNTTTPGVLEIRVRIRMSFVTSNDTHIKALAKLWQKKLPWYVSNGRLHIHVDSGGLPRVLADVLPTESIRGTGGVLSHDPAKMQASATRIENDNATKKKICARDRLINAVAHPLVRYQLKSVGKDHGYLTVLLQPALLSMQTVGYLDCGESSLGELGFSHMPFKEGDVIRSLLLFPLHVLRPRLHNMESLAGATIVEDAFVDDKSNTLAVLLRTNITSTHVQVYQSVYNRTIPRFLAHPSAAAGIPDLREEPLDLQGVLLVRFQYYTIWSLQLDAPWLRNSLRIIPQPIVFIDHASSDSVQNGVDARGGNEATPGRAAACQSEGGWFAVDHAGSLSTIMRALQSRGENIALQEVGDVASTASKLMDEGDKHRCQYIIRSSSSSGLMIPAPDDEVVLIVQALGLMLFPLVVGWVMRAIRLLTCLNNTLEPKGSQEGKRDQERSACEGQADSSKAFIKKHQ